MHTFWTVLIVPAMLLAIWAIQAMRMQLIWAICLGCILFFVAWLSGSDLSGALAGEFGFGELSKRIAFRVLSATDLPIAQTGLACAVNLFASRFFLKAPNV